MIIYIILLAVSLLLTTAITILGAIASRKYGFNYSYISLFSILLYFGISYLGTIYIHATAGITLVGLIGLFEGTIGWKLSLKYDANLGELKNEMKEILDEGFNPHPILVLSMVIIYLFIGWLGTLMAA